MSLSRRGVKKKKSVAEIRGYCLLISAYDPQQISYRKSIVCLVLLYNDVLYLRSRLVLSGLLHVITGNARSVETSSVQSYWLTRFTWCQFLQFCCFGFKCRWHFRKLLPCPGGRFDLWGVWVPRRPPITGRKGGSTWLSADLLEDAWFALYGVIDLIL